jgi:hypothetical protein
LSNAIRSMRRAAARRSGAEPVRKEQLTIIHDDGGYSVLHPTKGWRRFTARRLAVIQRTAAMLAGRGNEGALV